MAPPKPLRLYRVYADAITAGPCFQGTTDDKSSAMLKADELMEEWPNVVIRATYGNEAEINWPWKAEES